MRSLSSIFACTFFVLLLIVSCSGRPRYVLSKDKMVEVLYDLQIANVIDETTTLAPEYRKSDYKERIIAGVLVKHDVTQAQLDSSIAWYSDNMEEYKKINDSLTARYNRSLDILRGEEQAMDRHRSLSLNRNYKQVYLTEEIPVYTFKRSIPQSEKGTLKFQFDVLGVDSLSKIEAAIYYVYKDTTVRNSMQVTADAHYSFEKPDLPDSLLNSINGYIRLRPVRNISPVLIYNIHYQDSARSENVILDQLQPQPAPAIAK